MGALPLIGRIRLRMGPLFACLSKRAGRGRIYCRRRGRVRQAGRLLAEPVLWCKKLACIVLAQALVPPTARGRAAYPAGRHFPLRVPREIVVKVSLAVLRYTFHPLRGGVHWLAAVLLPSLPYAALRICTDSHAFPRVVDGGVGPDPSVATVRGPARPGVLPCPRMLALEILQVGRV